MGGKARGRWSLFVRGVSAIGLTKDSGWKSFRRPHPSKNHLLEVDRAHSRAKPERGPPITDLFIGPIVLFDPILSLLARARASNAGSFSFPSRHITFHLRSEAFAAFLSASVFESPTICQSPSRPKCCLKSTLSLRPRPEKVARH